jgi:cyclopropane-fatty-acyl-phospholipid synthase
MNKLAEKEFLKYMEKLDACPYEIIIDGQKHVIGEGEPAFSVTVNELPSVSELMTSTSLALGEAYMDHKIEIEGDLYSALNAFMGQMANFTTDSNKLKKLIFTSESKRNQQKEVSSHYDIGNDFYKLWLDETMSYSCGYFENESSTLHEAQEAKADRILKKLNLKPGMKLCDIGCGWGYLIIRAAKEYGVSCVGITLSKEQKREVEERIKNAGLEDKVEVRLMDYRDLPSEFSDEDKKFDRIVSVGMVEHVGRGNYKLFFESAKKSLKKGGLFLLHYISALQEHPGDPWIKRYIFPGGVIPSLREMIDIAGDLRFYTLDVESLRRHYTKTLLCWNEAFQANRDKVVEMYDERFTRMWELYLTSCAATFMNGIIDLHQLLFTNDINNDLPMTRWY